MRVHTLSHTPSRVRMTVMKRDDCVVVLVDIRRQRAVLMVRRDEVDVRA